MSFLRQLILQLDLVFVKDSILRDRPTNERQARAKAPKAREFAGGTKILWSGIEVAAQNFWRYQNSCKAHTSVLVCDTD